MNFFLHPESQWRKESDLELDPDLFVRGTDRGSGSSSGSAPKYQGSPALLYIVYCIGYKLIKVEATTSVYIKKSRLPLELDPDPLVRGTDPHPKCHGFPTLLYIMNRLSLSWKKWKLPLLFSKSRGCHWIRKGTEALNHSGGCWRMWRLALKLFLHRTAGCLRIFFYFST